MLYALGWLGVMCGTHPGDWGYPLKPRCMVAMLAVSYLLFIPAHLCLWFKLFFFLWKPSWRIPNFQNSSRICFIHSFHSRILIWAFVDALLVEPGRCGKLPVYTVVYILFVIKSGYCKIPGKAHNSKSVHQHNIHCSFKNHPILLRQCVGKCWSREI